MLKTHYSLSHLCFYNTYHLPSPSFLLSCIPTSSSASGHPETKLWCKQSLPVAAPGPWSAALHPPAPHPQGPGNTLSDLLSSRCQNPGWGLTTSFHSNFCPLLQSLQNHPLPWCLHIYKVIIILTPSVGCFQQ